MSEEDEELERLKKEKMEEIMSKGKGTDFPDTPINVTDSNFQEVVEKYPLVVLDFWAEWCAACKPMTPVIERLAKKYVGDVVFGKMNVDRNSQIPSEFQISSIPTLLFIKNGSPIDKKIGAMPARQLEQVIREYLD